MRLTQIARGLRLRWRISVTACPVVLLAVVLAGCGVTVEDIHRWGAEARYQQIRDALKGSQDENIQEACAIQLGRGHFEWAIPDLIALTHEPSPRVRLAAVQALGAYAGRDVYLAILQRLGDPNASVAESAERILRTWGSETYDVVMEALSDRSFEVRAAAAGLLGRMGGAAAGSALLRVAQTDQNPVVRREAVRALGRMKYAPAASFLYHMQATETANEVALEAGKALEAIGGFAYTQRLAVAPPAASPGLEPLSLEVVNALRTGTAKARLCPVVPWPLDPAVKVNQRSVASVLKSLEGSDVDDLLVVVVGREDNRVVVNLERYRVAGQELVQSEKVVGYLTEKETLTQDAINAFIRNYK